jgi:hypothetical protein
MFAIIQALCSPHFLPDTMRRDSISSIFLLIPLIYLPFKSTNYRPKEWFPSFSQGITSSNADAILSILRVVPNGHAYWRITLSMMGVQDLLRHFQYPPILGRSTRSFSAEPRGVTVSEYDVSETRPCPGPQFLASSTVKVRYTS